MGRVVAEGFLPTSTFSPSTRFWILARCAWASPVVDPNKRLVSVYRSRQEVRVLTVDETMDGGDVVPGWRVAIRELFAE